MMLTLKAANQWVLPDIPLENVPKNAMVVDSSQNIEVPAESIFKKLTEAELRPV